MSLRSHFHWSVCLYYITSSPTTGYYTAGLGRRLVHNKQSTLPHGHATGSHGYCSGRTYHRSSAPWPLARSPYPLLKCFAFTRGLWSHVLARLSAYKTFYSRENVVSKQIRKWHSCGSEVSNVPTGEGTEDKWTEEQNHLKVYWAWMCTVIPTWHMEDTLIQLPS